MLKFIILFFTILLSQISFGQNSKFLVRLNAIGGIGLEQHRLDNPSNSSISFDSDKVLFSAGGGGGFEAGIGYLIQRNVVIEVSAAFQIFSQNTNTYSNANSAAFNRKIFLVGIKYKVPLNKKSKPITINFGGGPGLAIPGILKITKDSYRLGGIYYKQSFAAYALSELEIPVGKKKKNYLNGGVRFKYMSFEVDASHEDQNSDIPPEYQNLSGAGFDIFLGFVFGF